MLSMKKQIYLLGLLIAVLYGCTAEDNSITPLVPGLNDGKIKVSFNLDHTTSTKVESSQKIGTTLLSMEPGVWADVARVEIEVQQLETKTAEAVPIDSTLRVVVYKRRVGGKTPDPALDQLVANNTYSVINGYYLAPAVVNSAGSVTTGNASEMYLLNDQYDFYFYTPAIPLSTDSTVKVNNGMDFASGMVADVLVDEKNTWVNIPVLQRQTSRIEFTIQPDQSYTDATSIKIGELGMNLLRTSNAPYTLKLGESIVAIADTSDNHVIASTNFTQILPNKIQGFDYILPKVAGDLYLYFNLAVNGLGQTYIAILPNVSFESGSNYIYNVLIKQNGSTAVEQANCYMVLPGQSLTFPVAQSVNGGANLLKPWTASVYWESSSSFLSVKSTDRKNGTITVSTTGTGNGLVVLKQYGRICWSWHIWGTDYNPSLTTGFTASGNVLEVEGGEVHRYNNDFFSTTNKVIMDRNLGALTSQPNDPSAYGMLYQWGRKDPFLPSGLKVQGVNTSVNGGPVRLQTSISNPTVFYYSGFIYYNWAVYPGEYWEDDAKTIFDPCPPGWRVPASSVWQGLDQSDIVQDPEGKGIIYSPSEAFFPFTGQRGYEYGNFKNVGAAGYQWSADESSGIIDFIDYGESFFFSAIGLNDTYNLPKASGLSVRCVQE